MITVLIPGVYVVGLRTFINLYSSLDVSTLGSKLAHLMQYSLTSYYFPKYHMHIIQPGGFHQCNIKLTWISILLSLIRHHHLIWLIMFVDEVFISELLSINRLTPRTVLIGYIPSLYHIVREDPVKDVPLVVEILTGLAFALFTCAETSEVFCCFRAVWVEFNLNLS